MQEATNGTTETEDVRILTLDEKWGSNQTPTMRRPGKNLPQNKNVIKRRTLQAKRNPRTQAKVKIIRKEKRVREASAHATMNCCYKKANMQASQASQQAHPTYMWNVSSKDL